MTTTEQEREKLTRKIYEALGLPYLSERHDAVMRIIEARDAQREAEIRIELANKVDKYIREVLPKQDTWLGGYLSMNPMNVTSLANAIRWALVPMEVIGDMQASLPSPKPTDTNVGENGESK